MEVKLAVVLFMAAAASAQGNRPGWVQPRFPPPNTETGLVYHEARQRLVLYGGQRMCTGPCPAPHQELWEWDGARWQPLRLARSPIAYEASSMVYDSARQRVVLFGGKSTAPSLNYPTVDETWEWDGFAWQQRTPAVSPVARGQHAMAYDRARGVVVLFGGTTRVAGSGGELNDTWEWDGVSWTQRQPAQSPPPRSGHGLAYDAVRGVVVMFGGNDTRFPPRHYDDTWEWDGATWRQIDPPTRPPGLRWHTMAFDPVRQRVVLYGGTDVTNREYHDTWEWDGATWTRRSQTGPGAAYFCDMAYEQHTQRMVLYGGQGDGHAWGETWEWDGQAWTLRAQPPVEPKEQGTLLAYDRARGQTIGFGDGTWAFDGAEWAKLAPPQSPSERDDSAMVWDSARRRVLLFGGATSQALDDTWEWDGATWTRRQPATSPPARSAHGMAFDTARGRAVVFGGHDPYGFPVRASDDTWEWDGVDWQEQHPALSPPPRAWSSMAYDPIRQRVLLFGGVYGSEARGDTWEWDGASWRELFPADSPSPRGYAAMTWDEARQRIVLVGGAPPSLNNNYYYGPVLRYEDVWEWDGASWTQIVTEGPKPRARIQAGIAFDAGVQGTVLFGGENGYENSLAGTWIYTEGLAQSRRIGTGCAGSGGVPVLGTFGPAALGRANFALDLAQARANATAVAWLAVAPVAVPLAGECTLYVDLGGPWAGVPGSTNAAGAASFALPLPALASLLGVTVWSQAAVVDPAGVFPGITLSQGLELTLGR